MMVVVMKRLGLDVCAYKKVCRCKKEWKDVYIVVSVGHVYEFVCISDLGEIMSSFLGMLRMGVKVVTFGESGRKRAKWRIRKNDAFVLVLFGEL